MKKLIIIPAYNESASILGTVQMIEEKAPEFDYIVINDCSTDQTEEILRANHIKHLQLPINLGIGGAVQTGYRYAHEHDYDLAVQVDGDGQHDPEFLKVMAAEFETAKESGQQVPDMIIGSRFIEKQGFQSSTMRRIGISYFAGLIKLLTGTKITDPTSGLRMIGKRGIGQFADSYPRDYPEPESAVALLRKKMYVKEIPVIMRERQGGVSSIRMKTSIYYMIKVTLAIFVEMLRR